MQSVFTPMLNPHNVTLWWNEDLTAKWATESFGLWWVLLLLFVGESYGAGVVTGKVFYAVIALGIMASAFLEADPSYTQVSLSIVLRAVELCLYVKRPETSVWPVFARLPLHHLAAAHPYVLAAGNVLSISSSLFSGLTVAKGSV